MMAIAQSTYYGAPAADCDAEIVASIEAICAEFEAYGYRRVIPAAARAETRQRW
jgi:putative transposase